MPISEERRRQLENRLQQQHNLSAERQRQLLSRLQQTQEQEPAEYSQWDMFNAILRGQLGTDVPEQAENIEEYYYRGALGGLDDAGRAVMSAFTRPAEIALGTGPLIGDSPIPEPETGAGRFIRGVAPPVAAAAGSTLLGGGPLAAALAGAAVDALVIPPDTETLLGEFLPFMQTTGNQENDRIRQAVESALLGGAAGTVFDLVGRGLRLFDNARPPSLPARLEGRYDSIPDEVNPRVQYHNTPEGNYYTAEISVDGETRVLRGDTLEDLRRQFNRARDGSVTPVQRRRDARVERRAGPQEAGVPFPGRGRMVRPPSSRRGANR